MDVPVHACLLAGSRICKSAENLHACLYEHNAVNITSCCTKSLGKRQSRIHIRMPHCSATDSVLHMKH